MRSPVADLLADLAAGLDELHAEWYLFGARAAILHGVARLTADVDATIRLPASVSTEALVQGLERHGFHQRVTEPHFLARTRVIPCVHQRTSLPLDLVLAGPGLEDQFFERIVERTIEDVRIPVASAEDLVVMKVLAGRPKDLDDIASIITSYGESLDATYVRKTLSMLERAIGQSDLLPAFEQVLARTRAR